MIYRNFYHPLLSLFSPTSPSPALVDLFSLARCNFTTCLCRLIFSLLHSLAIDDHPNQSRMQRAAIRERARAREREKKKSFESLSYLLERQINYFIIIILVCSTYVQIALFWQDTWITVQSIIFLRVLLRIQMEEMSREWRWVLLHRQLVLQEWVLGLGYVTKSTLVGSEAIFFSLSFLEK